MNRQIANVNPNAIWKLSKTENVCGLESLTDGVGACGLVTVGRAGRSTGKRSAEKR